MAVAEAATVGAGREVACVAAVAAAGGPAPVVLVESTVTNPVEVLRWRITLDAATVQT